MREHGVVKYVADYGWTLFIVVVVGFMLWRAGLFGTTVSGVAGFTTLVPETWSFVAGPGASSIVFSNRGDAELFGVSMTLLPGSSCLENGSGTFGTAVRLQLNGTSVRPGGYIAASPTCTARCSSRAYSEGVKLLVRVIYALGDGTIKSEDGVIQGKCG